MNNQLPNKLLMLRKYYNYSQQDISEKLGVDVSEYMKWENGSELCSMSQLLRLSRIFKINLDDLFNNNVVIKLPDNDFDNSIEIPFLNNSATANETTLFDIPIINDSNTSTMEKTIITRKISENQMEEVEVKQDIKPIKKVKKEEIRKEVKESKKTNPIIYIVALILFTILGFGVFKFLLKPSKDSSNIASISDINRLSASSQSTFYLQSKGSVVSKGNKIDTSKFNNVVQISSLSNFLLGLNEDGSVVCSGSGCNIKDFNNVKMISAGKNHSLALNTSNEVLCNGSDVACNVKDFKDVSFIFAGYDESFAISNGNVLYSGNSSKKSEITSLKGIKSLFASKNYLAALTNSNQVKVISLNDSKDINTSSFNNIKMVVAGDDFVAGLDVNGKVHVEGNKEIKDITDKFSNIKYISANSDYLIAVDNNNIMFGAGNNKYNQFDSFVGENSSEAKQEIVKLEKVSNIKFTESDKSLLITWDKVENAENYQISMNVSGNYTVKSSTNSLTIDSSKLLPNTEYTITIVANPNSDKFTSSDPLITAYKYNGIKEVKKYNVIFYDYDGSTVLNQQQVDEGGNATPPNEPKREGYKFVSWNGVYTNITKDTKITAQYEKLKAKMYTVSFRDIDGSIISNPKDYEENSIIKAPDVSSLKKENSVFSNWNPAFEEKVSKEVAYVAVYKCLITLENGEVINPDSTGKCACPAGTLKEGDKCIASNQEGSENTVTP